jgi:hypothetical protein
MFLFFINDDIPPGLFYCPQTIPDYTINYTITPSFTATNYCPQATPNQSITFTITPSFTVTNYCPQTTPDYSFLTPP